MIVERVERTACAALNFQWVWNFDAAFKSLNTKEQSASHFPVEFLFPSHDLGIDCRRSFCGVHLFILFFIFGCISIQYS